MNFNFLDEKKTQANLKTFKMAHKPQIQPCDRGEQNLSKRSITKPNPRLSSTHRKSTGTFY